MEEVVEKIDVSSPSAFSSHDYYNMLSKCIPCCFMFCSLLDPSIYDESIELRQHSFGITLARTTGRVRLHWQLQTWVICVMMQQSQLQAPLLETTFHMPNSGIKGESFSDLRLFYFGQLDVLPLLNDFRISLQFFRITGI